LSAADRSARILGEHNNMTRSQVAEEVDHRRGSLAEYLSDVMAKGTSIRAVVPKGASSNSESIQAVILAGGHNVNQDLISQGYGQYREDLGGSESRAMHSILGRTAGSIAEGLAFQGDSRPLRPGVFILKDTKTLARTRRRVPGSNSFPAPEPSPQALRPVRSSLRFRRRERGLDPPRRSSVFGDENNLELTLLRALSALAEN
jgi:hypothetical protein